MFWECYHMHKQQLPDHSSFLHGVSLITVPNYIYFITVNFERENFRELVENMRKWGCSLVLHAPKFCGENFHKYVVTKPQNWWKFSPSKVFCYMVLKTKIRTKLHIHKPKHSSRTTDNSESQQLYWACQEHKPQLALALQDLLNILSWVNAVYSLTFIDN